MIDSSRRPKIVLIDDSELVREMVADALEEVGYDIRTLDSPIGASAIVARESPNLVLLDLSMPALTGDALLGLFRKHPSLKSTKVVLYSDRPKEELERVAQQSGADGYIQKTGDEKLFIKQVQTWLPLD